MNLTSKKTSLIILGVTAVVCSKLAFFFFNDPEGPNLLIVTILAVVLYFPSFVFFTSNFFTTNSRRLLLAISIQIIVVFILLAGISFFDSYVYNKKQELGSSVNYKNIEYLIESKKVALTGEFRYFGNDLVVDLNGDGRDDIVFLITQESAGSGLFYYVVAALNADGGYIGSDGYLLGDRISPQTTELSRNPRHKNVIVVNYADRAMGEPMTVQPSIGKSVYLKIDQENRWGIVMADFEGESR